MKRFLALCAVVLGAIISFADEVAVATNNDSPPADLQTRVFKVDPNIFLANLRRETKASADASETEIAANYFASKGIDSVAVAYNEERAMLLVRATASDLSKLEKLVQQLNTGAPQILMKAYFIEVPKAGFVIPQASTNSAAGRMTGIFTREQTKNLLQLLKQKPGAETLAEPQVLMTTGQPTQIQIDGNPGHGAIVELVPNLLADGYTINLKVAVTEPVTLNALVNLYDGQAVLLSKADEKPGDKQLIVLAITTIVDSAGKRAHSDDELSFTQNGPPAQPK